MRSWPELIDTLMLGTRESLPPGDSRNSPEHVLLSDIALAYACRRAGFAESRAKTLPEIDPAPPETLPACSLAAVESLHRITAAPYTRELARDWFLYIRARGKRVPHTALPFVLSLATQFPDFAPYVVPVLGARGRWIVERTKAYEALLQPTLWNADAGADLRGAALPEDNAWLSATYQITRDEMMKGLAHE